MRLPSRSLTHTCSHCVLYFACHLTYTRSPKDRDILSCECSCLVRHNDVQINTRKRIYTHIHADRQTQIDLLSCARQCTRKKNPAPLSLPLSSLSLSLLAILLVPFHTPLITFSSPPRFPACLPNPAQSSLQSRRSRFQ